ncbi:MAG TPA: universal stress protein [Burkholderiales bacterium]
MYKRVLVPVDGSAVSMAGLDEAIRLAKNGAKLRVLHVVDGIAFVRNYSVFTASAADFREAGRKLMEEVMAYVRRKGVKAEPQIIENLSGRAADSIIDAAKKWRADLIVMGTHGRRGVNRMVLGSDAEIVIRTSPVPVLLVRGTKQSGRKRRRKAA